MKKFNKGSTVSLLVVLLLVFSLAGAIPAFAATTPSLGAATSYGILASTYTNTVAGTTINGDLGYTTGPAVAPTVSGVTHLADSSYTQAGTDQAAALSSLNAQPCDFNFGSATDLSLLSQPLVPGVYCITGATSIGTGGITLNGSGTYIFRINGALTTVANSSVTLTNGASACDVFWTPTAATTLGANSTFAGTDIGPSGITIGSTVTWAGRALAFGGTTTTDNDIISVPTCSVPIPAPIPTPQPTPTPIQSPVQLISPVPTILASAPKLPNAGLAPEIKNGPAWNIIIPAAALITLLSFYLARKRRTI